MTIVSTFQATVCSLSSPSRRDNGFLPQWRPLFPLRTLSIDIVEEEGAHKTMSAAFHIFVTSLLRRACTILRQSTVLRIARDSVARKWKGTNSIRHSKAFLSALAAAIFATGALGGNRSINRFARTTLLTWVSGVAIFAREIFGGQAPGGSDPWLRSLDLSIPESHDRRIGVYDVLKGVENTPSDNLLFAVARDVLTTYELTKPFLEEVVRVHQQLRARHRENRKANGEDAQNGNTTSGGIVAQTVQTPVGKKRPKRVAGSIQAAGVAPAPTAGIGATPAAALNASRSGATASAADGVGSAATTGEHPFAGAGGPKLQQAQQQPPQHRQHGLRFPATVMHSKDVDASRGVPVEGGWWWSAKKTKRGDERNARKQGSSIQEEISGNRGSHTRRKYYREMSRGQPADQGRTQSQQTQHQLQYVSKSDSGDGEQLFSTSSM